MNVYVTGQSAALEKLGLAKSKPTITAVLNDPKVLEGIAELEHKQWETWAKSIQKSEDLSPERIKRWKKSFKAYKKLPEKEKNLDREWARKVRKVIKDKAPK